MIPSDPQPSLPKTAVRQKTRVSRKYWIVAASCLLVVIGCGIGVVWRLKRVQLESQLLAAADAAEAEEDWGAVESALRHYCRFRPGNASVNFRIGRAIASEATDREDRLRALPFFAKATSLSPENDDYRIHFAECEVEENPENALRSANTVLQRDPENRVALRVKAIGLTRIASSEAGCDPNHLANAYHALAAALEIEPDNQVLVELAAEFCWSKKSDLSVLLNRSQSDLQQEVLRRFDRLVDDSTKEEEARLSRLLFRRKLGLIQANDQSTREDIERLLELSPRSSVVQLLASGFYSGEALAEASQGEAAISQSKAFRAAIQHAESALDIGSGDPVHYWFLAQLHMLGDQFGDAEEVLKLGVRATASDSPVLMLRLAETQIAAKRWDDADNSLLRLEDQLRDEVKPGSTEYEKRDETVTDGKRETGDDSLKSLRPLVAILRSQWLLGLGNPKADAQRAIEVVDQVIQEDLGDGARSLLHFLKGIANGELERWGIALGEFQESAKFAKGTVLPELAEAHALHQMARHREASAQYRNAMERAKQSGMGRINANQVWIEVARCEIDTQSHQSFENRDWGKFSEAIAHLDSTASNGPTSYFLQFEVAHLSGDVKWIERIESRFEYQIASWKATADYWKLLANCLLRLERPGEARQAFEHWRVLANQVDLEFAAELAEREGDYRRANELWQEVDKMPGRKQKHRVLGRRVQLALQAGDTEYAAKLIRGALEESPKAPELWLQLANVAWIQADEHLLEEAISQLRGMVGDRSREYRIALAELEILRVSRADRVDSRQFVTRTQELLADFPNDGQVIRLAAVSAEIAGRPADAIRLWQRIISTGERDPAIKYRLASLLIEQNRGKEALEVCFDVSQINIDIRTLCLIPKIISTEVVLPHELQRAEDLFARALRELEGEERIVLVLNLAVLREYQGRPEEAIELTKSTGEQNPEVIELQNNLAWFLAAYRTDGAETAVEIVSKSIEQLGPVPQLLDTQGVALIAAGRAGEAVGVLESAVEADEPSAARLLHLAEAYQQVGRIDDSRETLRRAEALGLKSLCPRDRFALRKLRGKVG